MRRIYDFEAQQGYADEQEADVVAVTDRIERRKDKEQSAIEKESTPGEESAIPIPLAPRPWLRSVAYTATGMVVVPRKPYHQVATFVGTNNIPFDISYNPTFPPMDTITLPGDRDSTIKVFAGQEVWMRSQILDGVLAIIIEPYLGAYGQTLETKGDHLDKPSWLPGPGSATK